MVMPSWVPATTMSNSLSSICWKVGFTTNSPLMQPMRTAAIGPWNGMSEIDTAAEDAMMEMMSGGLTMSELTTVGTTCISRPKALSNNGRIGRSIKRLTKISLSLGRPSRLRKPPGIFPAA
jgi:hypothetical protein